MTDFSHQIRKNSVGLRATPGGGEMNKTHNGVFSIRLNDQKDRSRGTSQLMHTINGATPAVHRIPAFASSSNSNLKNRSGRMTNHTMGQDA